jgi:hypothetical protein
MPAPFLRALTAGDGRSDRASGGYQPPGQALYVAAARALRARIEPALARSGGQPVPVATADPAVGDLIALSALASGVERLRRLVNPPPGFVTDPDHARLTVTVNGATATYTLMGADGSGITGTARVAPE